MDQAVEVVETITRVGLGLFLLVILLAGNRKWWTFGWAYREMEAQRDAYRKQVDDLLAIAIQRTIDDARPMDD